MRTLRSGIPCLLLAAIAAAACHSKESQPNSPPPLESEESLLTADEADLPTAEAALVEARRTIDEMNADAELEKLEQELGDG